MVKFLGLGKETTYGVAVERTKFLDIVSESLNPEHGMIDVETAAYREMRLRIPGPYLVSGDIEILPDANSILEVLAAVCGQEPTPTESPTGVYTWTFKPTANIFSLTLEVAPEIPVTSPKARVLDGAVFKALSWEAPARELLTATIGAHARRDTLLNTPSTPTFSTVKPFVFYEGSLEMPSGTALAEVTAFSLSHETDIPDDIHTLGSRFLEVIHVGGYTLTGSLDIVFKKWDIFQLFWEKAGATGPSGKVSPTSIKLKFSSVDEIISGYPYYLEIYLPKVYLDTTEANIDRRERIMQSVDFTAIYDATEGAGVKYTVRNDRSALWT